MANCGIFTSRISICVSWADSVGWLKRRRLGIVISIHLSLHKILLAFKDAEVVALFIPRDDSTTGDNNANHRQASALLSRRRWHTLSRILVGILQ